MSGYSYDHRTKAAGAHADKLHKGFTELQHAITTIDQVEFQSDLSPAIKSAIKACVKDLERVAEKLDKIEHDARIHEKSSG